MHGWWRIPLPLRATLLIGACYGIERLIGVDLWSGAASVLAIGVLTLLWIFIESRNPARRARR
jgi:hypothetical protein